MSDRDELEGKMTHGDKPHVTRDEVEKIGWVTDYFECSDHDMVDFTIETPIGIEYSVLIDDKSNIRDELFGQYAADEYVKDMCIYYANEQMPCTITEALENGRFIGDKLEALLRLFNDGEIIVKH